MITLQESRQDLGTSQTNSLQLRVHQARAKLAYSVYCTWKWHAAFHDGELHSPQVVNLLIP